MLGLRSNLTLFLGATALLAAEGLPAQVVATETLVSNAEARLTVARAGESDIEIAFREGSVRLNGETVGSYDEGGRLDRSWRKLLGELAGADAGSLAAALGRWDPPQGLRGDGASLADLIDRNLEALAQGAAVDEQDAAEATAVVPAVPQAQADLGQVIETLISGAGYEAAARAIRKAHSSGLDVILGEEVHVDRGDVVDGTLVIVDGDIHVEGEIEGDLIVSDGTVTLSEGGRVRGDLHLLDARLDRDGGRVSGAVTRAPRVGAESDLRREIRDELRTEIRNELRREARSSRSLFHGMGNGITGLLRILVQLAILVAIGLVALHFAPENLTRIAEAARDYPARSAAVGMAGAFLLIPVWLLGVIALAISIVGIPLLIAWVPIFPIAASLATLLGFLAVALNVGNWVQRHDFERLRWASESNHVNHLILGVGALLAAFAAASVVGVFGHWLDFFTTILSAIGCLGMLAAAVVGFGAVLLTRGGRQTVYEGSSLDFDWPRWERTERAGGTVADDVMDTAANAADAVAEVVEDAAATVGSAAEEVVQAAADVVDDAAAAVESAADQVMDVAGDVVDTAAEVVDDVVAETAEVVDDVVAETAEVVDDAVEAVEETAEAVEDAVAEALDDEPEPEEEN